MFLARQLLEIQWLQLRIRFPSPIDHRLQLTRSLVQLGVSSDLIASSEEMDCWEALHVVLIFEFELSARINLCHLDFAFQLGGQLGPLWCKLLAVSAPRRIELDEPSVLRVQDLLVEGVFG